ncbi:MAG: SufB/SufD family protein [Cyanobium sp.]
MLTAPLPNATGSVPEARSWSDALLASLPASSEGPLALQQSRCRSLLSASPMPSRREEDWRFTDLAPLLAVAPRPLPVAAPPSLPTAEGSLRLVLDGGSDPLAGVRLPDGIVPLSAAELEQHFGTTTQGSAPAVDRPEAWPVVLNGAVAPRMLALRVRGPVAPVLELVCDAGSAEGVQALRVLLLLDPGVSLQLLQVHRSAGGNLTSIVVETRLAAGARLCHGLLAQGSESAVLLAHLAVDQQPGSEFSLVSASSGWGLIRLEPRVVQSDGRALTRLRSLQRVEGRQIADTHSHVSFHGTEGRLDQLHKVVADGAGRSVFNGAVRVPRQAQRTDAAQLSRSLLLSDRARVDTKPELEIVADDVRCTHGATISRLQHDELFYLRSRGIAADLAARLLLRGYCEEVLRELPVAAAVWQPLDGKPAPEADAP